MHTGMRWVAATVVLGSGIAAWSGMAPPRALALSAFRAGHATLGAVNLYLWSPDLSGESHAADVDFPQNKHNAIDIESYSLGATNPTILSGSAGRMTFEQLTIKKAVDVSSPSLFTAVAVGQPLGLSSGDPS